MRIATLVIVLLSQTVFASNFEDGLRFKQQLKFDEAESAFQKATQENDKNADAFAELASAQASQRKFDEALANQKIAMKLRPKALAYKNSYARYLLWSGKPEAANSAATQILAHYPNDVEAMVLKGDILIQMGRVDDGRDLYYRALEIEPNSVEILKKVSQGQLPYRWRFDFDYNARTYTGGVRPAEDGEILKASHRLRDQTWIWALGGAQNIYFKNDKKYGFGAGRKLFDELFLLELQWVNSPTAYFTPDNAYTANIELFLWKKLTPTLKLERWYYNGTLQRFFTPGLRLELPMRSHVSIEYEMISDTLEQFTGLTKVRGDIQWRKYMLFAGFGFGSQSILPEPINNQTYYDFGVEYEINRLWSTRFEYDYVDRQSFYKETAMTFGATYKF